MVGMATSRTVFDSTPLGLPPQDDPPSGPLPNWQVSQVVMDLSPELRRSATNQAREAAVDDATEVAELLAKVGGVLHPPTAWLAARNASLRCCAGVHPHVP